jgi:hypothetical protein
VGDDALVAAQKPAFLEFLKGIRFEAATAAPAALTSAENEPDPHAAISNAAPSSASNAPIALITPKAMSRPASSGTAAKPDWSLPAGWKEVAPGPMQLAKFNAGGEAGKAEATVSVLPGEAGGRSANVNRWRGQLGLPVGSDADIEKSLLPLKIEGAQTYAVDLVSEKGDRRMLAAGVALGGQTWFFKLTGEDALVERQKAAFLEFVQTVKYPR